MLTALGESECYNCMGETHPTDTLVGLQGNKTMNRHKRTTRERSGGRVSNSAAAAVDQRPSCPGAAHQHWTTAASSNPKKGRVIPGPSPAPRIPLGGCRAMRKSPVPVAILSATKPTAPIPLMGRNSLFFSSSSRCDTTPFDSEVRMTAAGRAHSHSLRRKGGTAALTYEITPALSWLR